MGGHVNSRTKSSIVLAALASAFVFQLTTFRADADAIVIRAKRIYTVTKGVIENGEILILDGKIQAIGPKVERSGDGDEL